MSGAVPQLRFPGFAGEWERITVGAIGPVLMCKRVMKDQTSPEGDVPFFKIGTFGKDADAFIEQDLFDEFRAKYSYPNPGDILISAAGTIGRLVVFDGKPAYFQDSNIVWVANDETRTLNPFLYYCYQNTQWTTEDTTIARLYNDNLRSIEIVQPNIAEQQKIADFLGTVDAKIDALRRKKSGLETFKSGLMQRLFSQTLRFTRDDGTDFPDWEPKTLGDLFRNRVEKDTGGLPIFSVTQANGMVPRAELDRDFGGDEDATGYRKAVVGDLVYNTMRMWQGAVGIAPASCSVSPAYVILAPRDAAVPEFFVQWLREPVMVQRLKSQSYGLTEDRLRLYYNDFARIDLAVPHADEQRKIAEALSALDAKITAVADQITHMEVFKKGLLQRMFI